MSKVTLYDGDEAVGLVSYTDNLDSWNGSNFQCGGTGLHLGCGKTKDGQFFLCHGTQWQGGVNTAEIVSEEVARDTVLRNNPDAYESIFGEKPPVLD